jgi:hypothetical protein
MTARPVTTLRTNAARKPVPSWTTADRIVCPAPLARNLARRETTQAGVDALQTEYDKLTQKHPGGVFLLTELCESRTRAGARLVRRSRQTRMATFLQAAIKWSGVQTQRSACSEAIALTGMCSVQDNHLFDASHGSARARALSERRPAPGNACGNERPWGESFCSGRHPEDRETVVCVSGQLLPHSIGETKSSVEPSEVSEAGDEGSF